MSGTALLFPGQGAQAVGMVGEWLESHRICQDLFSRASVFLGYDLAAVCRNGPPERLDTTDVSQPALLVTSLAMLEILRLREDSPLKEVSMVAGLSLGEYTALCFAGVLSFEDALHVVAERGRAMQDCAEKHAGAMTAVLGLTRTQVELLVESQRCDDALEVANVLCPGNTVVSGAVLAIERVEAAAGEVGAMRCIRLGVAGAFHTSLMSSAVSRLQAAIEQVNFNSATLPVISNVDALPHRDPDEIRSLLVRQIVGVVEWEASVRYLLESKIVSFWEVGPGRVLRGLLKRIDRSIETHSVFE